MINKIPVKWVLKGKKLFDVIGMIHQGIDKEVERVKELKHQFEAISPEMN